MTWNVNTFADRMKIPHWLGWVLQGALVILIIAALFCSKAYAQARPPILISGWSSFVVNGPDSTMKLGSRVVLTGFTPTVVRFDSSTTGTTLYCSLVVSRRPGTVFPFPHLLTRLRWSTRVVPK